MAKERIARLTNELREDLVAYLDGELDENNIQAVEKTLANNNVVRHDLEQLSRTYDLLDFLPKAEVSQEFTAKTMTMVTVRASQVWPSENEWKTGFRRGFLLLVWCAVLSASAYAGFHITTRIVKTDADILVDDLPVIEKLDQLQEVENLKFLEKLEQSDLFDLPRSSTP
ncbi:MAG: hypothetical protein U0903_06265 [Planctomycetales bacterium]